MRDKIRISKRFFTSQELGTFKEEHGYDVTEISYACSKEIDFSEPDEKEFLLKYGTPKILARFGY